ncbi:roadblock/LC7 domain-containing protein [Streptomyces sp. NPDC003435]
MDDRAKELSWLLGQFVKETDGARAALVTSLDGLMIAHHNLADDGGATAGRLSAITSGVLSLAKAASALLDGDPGVNQVLMDVEGGHLYIMAAGSGALVTVLASNEADPGVIGFETAMMIRRFPDDMTVPARVLSASGPEQ